MGGAQQTKSLAKKFRFKFESFPAIGKTAKNPDELKLDMEKMKQACKKQSTNCTTTFNLFTGPLLCLK